MWPTNPGADYEVQGYPYLNSPGRGQYLLQNWLEERGDCLVKQGEQVTQQSFCDKGNKAKENERNAEVNPNSRKLQRKSG